MTKHTPGTWSAECVGVSSAGDDGVEVYEVVADGHVRVAEHLSAADARLIVAAPDLLAALKNMVARYCDDETLDSPLDEAARAAIAKAEAA